ncbi:MAG TPA: hypothetical protein VNF69_16865 [Burkholderiales bacterium]|nr:hypothetical protein [Burkholderiales bacterium]
MSIGQWQPDVNSIALPLLASGGESMALLCGGPAYAFPADRLRKLIAPQLRRTAEAIAHEIGGLANEREIGPTAQRVSA